MLRPTQKVQHCWQLCVAWTLYRRLGKFRSEKIFADYLQHQKLKQQNISSTYKWRKFIWWSGHSDESKAMRKFNQRNIFPTKNSQSLVFGPVLCGNLKTHSKNHTWIKPIPRRKGDVLPAQRNANLIMEILHRCSSEKQFKIVGQIASAMGLKLK